MATQRILVKRHGHAEEYDGRKVYASVYAAALNAHLSEMESEALADKVSAAVDKYVHGKDGINSAEIRDRIVGELGGVDNDVAYLYLHHLDIS